MIAALVRQGRHTVRRWMLEPGVQQAARYGAYALAGFCLSAASLLQGALPMVMGLVWASRGAEAILAAAGGSLGYWFFWGQAGQQGIWCSVLALVGTLLLAERRIAGEQPLLIPSVSMLAVSAVGLGYQLLAGDTTPVALYLLRVAIGGAVSWLFPATRQRQEPLLRWLTTGFVTLSLAQILPTPWLGLGFVAAGAMSVAAAFPCGAITGLALDLAGVTSVPMAAVTVLAYLMRFLPGLPARIRGLIPGLVGMALMGLLNRWEGEILPGLFLGGCLGLLLPGQDTQLQRRGQTGAAQVRLEIAASILTQMQTVFLEASPPPVDTDALLSKAVTEACGSCALRKHCPDAARLAQLPGSLLREPLYSPEALPVRCRKSGRLLVQLRQSQTQLRTLEADRKRQAEYRAAVVQQYGFLSRFLQEQSDWLSRREDAAERVYDPEVEIYGNREKDANGDRCLHFSGPRDTYYILLCDGMGTGLGAVQAAGEAGRLLKRMLCCGFPAADALHSFNSLCALGERVAAVTVDLCELSLRTGKLTVYKWGAAPSYLVSPGGVEKLGASTVPPGFAVENSAPLCCRSTLRRETVLLMASDGLSEETLLRYCRETVTDAGIRDALLDASRQAGQDDATVVTVRLTGAKN